jgi:16S rRNA (cytidine1402-2'-O)-methyltransferase
MRHYQIFPFDAGGRILDAVALDLESDVRAIRRALDNDFPHGCELWEGFRFIGYLPRRARELESSLATWRRTGGLLVAFDTGQRLARSLAVLAAHLPDARAAVCRELTKVHEEVVRGTLLELSGRYPVPGPDTWPAAAVRGEITLVIDLGRPLDAEAARRPAAAAAAGALLARGLSRRDTAAALHVWLGLSRREAERIAREVAARG